jgi:hypothetical protein
MPGFYVVDMDPKNNSTDRKIVYFTYNYDPDSDKEWDWRVALDFNVGGYVRFSNSLFWGQSLTKAVPMVSLRWDPPGDAQQPPFLSQHTYFDDQPLSSRDESYQETAVNFFADFVLSSYLSTRHYVVEPTESVLAALDGELPTTPEHVAQLAAADPDLLRYVRCSEQPFTPDQLSAGARQVCKDILEDAANLEDYLAEPEGYIEGLGDEITDAEREALIHAAHEKPALVRRAFDSVELGRAPGDHNTYILIGVNPETKLPDDDHLEWLFGQLGDFVEQNGFMPAFGPFVTEARQRAYVVLGPGTGQREHDYLTLFGHHLIDRRDGTPIGQISSQTPSGPADPVE